MKGNLSQNESRWKRGARICSGVDRIVEGETTLQCCEVCAQIFTNFKPWFSSEVNDVAYFQESP